MAQGGHEQEVGHFDFHSPSPVHLYSLIGSFLFCVYNCIILGLVTDVSDAHANHNGGFCLEIAATPSLFPR